MNLILGDIKQATNLKGRHFLKLLDFSQEEVNYLLRLSARLKSARKNGQEVAHLQGKVIALIFEKNSTRTRSAFEVGAFHQGAHTSYIGPTGSHIGYKETPADTARVLGSMYDAILYRGHGQEIVEALAAHAGVPVYNGLTDEFHPTQVLADFLTMSECCPKPLSQQTLAYLGDGANNTANSLIVGAALMGLDLRLACPPELRPEQSLVETCQALANESGGSISLYDCAQEAVKGADFLYTDVWLSMGQAEEEWERRVELLKPYRVDSQLMEATGHPQAKFLHCLPAYHNSGTPMGAKFYEEHGLLGIEVSEEVFESEASVVFQQSENRLHTIKALMVATLGDID